MYRILWLLLLYPALLAAQDMEPRTYTNLPMGQNFVGAGYVYSDGELNPAPGVPIEDAQLTVQALVAAYVRSLDLWGRAGKIDVVAARTCFEGDAMVRGEVVEGDRCGLADPAVRLSYLFYGAPSMGVKEFMATPPGLVVGGSLKVKPPLGDYNNENLINHGANRWEFKPELGMSNRWGNWSVELSLSGAFYTENNRFVGRDTLEQDPLYQAQFHLIHHMKRGRWIALNTNYFWGGRSERNGQRQDDRQENSRIGVTYSLPLSRQQSLKLYASRGVVTTVGNDFDTFGLIWQYRWAD